jgi:hypothetical protein
MQRITLIQTTNHNSHYELNKTRTDSHKQTDKQKTATTINQSKQE